MPIQPINGRATSPAGTSTTQGSALDMNTFLRLLTVQLSTQNPLEPMSDRDFFAQMAQLGTVQGIDKLKQTLDVSQAATLMGKTVTAVRPFTDTGSGISDTVTGVVKKLTVMNGEYLLDLQTPDGGLTQVRMANIQAVSN
jgi:flagellar basal-body rod modification protein FlgD